MRITTLFILTLIHSSAGWADVCVKTGGSDNLSSDEQTAVKSLLVQAFQKAGEPPAEAACENEYTLTNIRLGKSITTKINGPKGSRTMQVDRIEELSSAYEQMAYSIIKGTKLGDNSSQGVTRHNVTAKQAVPLRVESDSLAVVNLGTGFALGSSLESLPINVGASYRYELDSFAIDIGGSFLFMVGDDDGTAFAQGTLSGLYFFNGEANHSLFAGAGLGLSALGFSKDSKFFDGGGMHARAAVGYAFFRASTIRMLVQADLTLPFYQVDATTLIDDDSKSEKLYAPVLGLTLGVAYTRSSSSTQKSIVRVF